MSAPTPAGPWETALAAHRAGDYAGAVAGYRQCLADAPDAVHAAENLVAALHQAGRSEEALAFAAEAARRFPASTDVLNNAGTVLSAVGRHERAARLFEQAVARDPAKAQLWLNLGQSRVKLKEPEAAVAAFAQAVARDPGSVAARVHLVHQCQQILAWERIDPHLAEIRRRIAAENGRVDPWVLMSVCYDPAEHLRCARAISRRIAAEARGQLGAAAVARPAAAGREPAGRLRLGYLSADFRDHPTSYLAVQLLESHDRERVETFGYAVDPPPADSPMRARLRRAFGTFRDLGGLTAVAAAGRIAEDRLDILVDLMGFTQGDRPDVLALRPAPVQIGFLGFAGSTGADFIDYIIADRHVLPPEDERYFTEAPLRMPFCYQVNDAGRPAILRPEGEARGAGRRAAGLPETGIVFSAFNQFYKLTPDILALWVRILGSVPGSVLWVVGYSEAGAAALRRRLEAGGIDPARLVVAPIANQSDHLPRNGLADIMLDTHPYGGHTIASDALRAGCPVITLAGRTFAARVGVSLLRTLGFPELIAADRKAYVRLAVDLATAPDRLADLQRRLWEAAQGHPMFDGIRFARDLERGLEIVRARHAAGKPAAPIDLSAEDGMSVRADPRHGPCA